MSFNGLVVKPKNKVREPSICIPRVFSNICEYRIKEIFQKVFGIDSIERVDIVRKKIGGAYNGGEYNDGAYNKVFVHFWDWPIEHAEIRKKLMDGKEIKIVYEQPWFWKCSASRSKKNWNDGIGHSIGHSIGHGRIGHNINRPFIIKDKSKGDNGVNDCGLPPLSILDEYSPIEKGNNRFCSNDNKKMKRGFILDNPNSVIGVRKIYTND